MEMLNFKLADDIMKNKTNNPKNSEYNIIYDGTINMQSVMNAQVVGSKGHFYESAKELEELIPDVVDHQG